MCFRLVNENERALAHKFDQASHCQEYNFMAGTCRSEKICCHLFNIAEGYVCQANGP